MRMGLRCQTCPCRTWLLYPPCAFLTTAHRLTTAVKLVSSTTPICSGMALLLFESHKLDEAPGMQAESSGGHKRAILTEDRGVGKPVSPPLSPDTVTTYKLKPPSLKPSPP
jgi:hypothetical protein